MVLQRRDPYWGNAVLLLYCDGENNSTTFVDSSQYHAVATRLEQAVLSTRTRQYGPASLLSPTEGAGLQYDDHVKWQILDKPFAMEAWIYRTTPSQVIFAQAAKGNTQFWFGIQRGTLQFLYKPEDASPVLLRSTTLVPDLEWAHVAVSRTNGVLDLYINGVAQLAEPLSDARSFQISVNVPVTVATGPAADIGIGGEEIPVPEVLHKRGVVLHTALNPGIPEEIVKTGHVVYTSLVPVVPEDVFKEGDVFYRTSALALPSAVVSGTKDIFYRTDAIALSTAMVPETKGMFYRSTPISLGITVYR